MLLNFDHNSNLSLVRFPRDNKIVKMCQFYSDSSRFFCNQLYRVFLKCVYKFSPRATGLEKIFFCSTLSEFENFLLCERILINVTTCQNKTSS
jgi:hypothetical protein